MAITTEDGLVAALAGGSQRANMRKASAATEGAGTFHSLWQLGGNPGAGANPPAFTAGAGYVPTDATAGAHPFNNPGGSNLLYLARLFAAAAVPCSLVLYDRLWACSGFSMNVNTLQAITTPGAVTRPDALGKGVEIWGEVYTAGGATGSTLTALYTDQDGNAAQASTYVQPANALSVGQMVPFSFAAGDTGARALASLQLSVATGVVGNFGLTLLRRLAEIPLPGANQPALLDAIQLGLPQVPNDACLAWMILCSAATSGEVLASFNLAEG